VIATLVDNVYDAVLTDDGRTTRAPFSIGPAQAPQFEAGSTTVGLMAEHGFSALVSVRRGTNTTTLLVDTGLSPGAMITHAGRPSADLPSVKRHLNVSGQASWDCQCRRGAALWVGRNVSPAANEHEQAA
jgi:metal-dependent hydrolase (beta-lactamase superfamily II)